MTDLILLAMVAALVMTIAYALLDGLGYYLIFVFAYFSVAFAAIGLFVPWAVMNA